MISYEEIAKIYKEEKVEEVKIEDKKHSICFEGCQTTTDRLISRLSKYKLPNLDSLNFLYLMKDQDLCKRFLENSFPRKVDYFSFNVYCTDTKPIGEYLPIFKKILKHVTKNVVIW